MVHLVIAGHGKQRNGTFDPGATGYIKKGEHKYLPFLAILVGIGLGSGAVFFGDVDLVYRAWAGGISGLMASGLFESYKSAKEDKLK